jgi:uncharacterized phage-associated protein
MVNIFDVAKYILHSIGGEVSTMMLHKLCYYSQAWHLAWYGVPLFSEDFVKRNNGPVCEELWKAEPVWFGFSEGAIKEKYLSGETLSLSEIAVIDHIVDDYGMFDGWQLSELSRREDPWKNAENDKIIPKEAMEEYYKNLKVESEEEEEKVVNVFDVAKYILHAIGEKISTMKLQKLCYYCQAWHLAWYGESLFPENFERWDNGPVCKELFNVHRGWFTICEDEIKKKYLGGKQLSLDEIRTIDQILEDYGMYNGAQLSEIAHGEDPWKNTPKGEVIPNEVMEEYYKNLKDEC